MINTKTEARGNRGWRWVGREAGGRAGAEEGLTGVARAAAKLLVLAVASSSASAPEQLAASALRRS